MRRTITISFVLIALIASNCGKGTKKGASGSLMHETDTGTAIISFREYEHDFGKVAEGGKVAYVFTFENKGTGNLVVLNASTSCGCTVPKYDTKPIPPGETGIIEVVFDTSGRNGIQTKTIKVNSNASAPVVLLKIVADVVINSSN
jgi:hypothetical protein